jgi:hypothetical protein
LILILPVALNNCCSGVAQLDLEMRVANSRGYCTCDARLLWLRDPNPPQQQLGGPQQYGPEHLKQVVSGSADARPAVRDLPADDASVIVV